MTQIEKVKALLINSPNGVCSTTFLKSKIPRFSHHIWTLRNDNWDIETDKCDLEGHNHKEKQYKYTWSAIYKADPPLKTKTVNLSEIAENKNLSLSPLDYIEKEVNDVFEKSDEPKFQTRKEKLEMINNMLKEKGLDTRLKEKEIDNER